MKRLPVTIIVVNWELKDETLKCVRSIERLDCACRVIVVDNGSSDGSAEYIARHCPQVELLAMSSNLGFGAACNQAIVHALEETSCDYVFLLNNDAMIHPHALSELVHVAEAYPQAGILGPKIYFSDTPNVLWYAGARCRRGVWAAVDIGRGQLDHGQFNTRREVDYVFGTAMLIRRSVLERIGLFDERFFLYLEDMDLCLRARAAGFSLLFVPQAHVWHKGSASTTHRNGMRKYHFVKSTLYFAMKHTSPLWVVPAVAFWALVFLRFAAADLLRGDVTALRSYGLGLLNGMAEASQNTGA